MDFEVNTPRLTLRPVQNADCETVHRLWTNGEVRRFLFDDRVISAGETQSFVEGSLRNFAALGYGLWLVFSPETGTLIGFAGFLPSDDEAPNLIYGVHPDFCGHGFATEAAQAVLEFAFKSVGLLRIKADVDEPNTASVRVLEKLGMTAMRRAIVNGRPLLYYELNAPG